MAEPARSIPDAAHAEEEAIRLSEEEGTQQQPPLQGCPIASQPITTLALICRCLDARDLLSVYKTGHLLNSAALHPLTFQHATGWTVQPWGEVENGVIVRGPSARLSSYAKAEAAFRSKLFCCFKFLTLVSRGSRIAHRRDTVPELHFLAPEQAPTQPPPVLRVLNLEYIREIEFGLPRRIATAPSLRYLQVLCVTLPMLLPTSRASGELMLPPGLRLIQITLQHSHSPILWESNGLAALLAPLRELRQLIFRDPHLAAVVPGRHDSTLRTSLVDIHALSVIEAAAPQIDEILWLISIKHDEMVLAMRQERSGNLNHPFPKLRKVLQLKVSRVGLLNEQLDDPNYLCMFPELRELRVYHKPAVAAAIQSSTQVLFDQLGSVSLPHLLSLTITNYLVGEATEANLTPLFRNFPTLKHFTSPRILLKDLKVYALLPNLLSTRDILWTKEMSSMTPAEMAACFPSLTSLHCWSAAYSSAMNLAHVLAAVPHLRCVLWNKEGPVHPVKLAAQLSKIEANRSRLLSKRAEAAAAALAAAERSKIEEEADAQAEEARAAGGNQKREREANPAVKQASANAPASPTAERPSHSPPAAPFVLPELDTLKITTPASSSAFASPPKRSSKYSAPGKHRVSGGGGGAAGKTHSPPSYGAGGSATITSAPLAAAASALFAFGSSSTGAAAPAVFTPFAFGAASGAGSATAALGAPAAFAPFGTHSFGTPAPGPAAAPFATPFVFHAPTPAEAAATSAPTGAPGAVFNPFATLAAAAAAPSNGNAQASTDSSSN